MNERPRYEGPACPIPLQDYPRVLLAHGGGGRLMHDLIGRIFLAAFGPPPGGPPHDGAVLDLGGTRLALTTDGHVVHPLFFPGGDIGSLAVNGTVNDLAMCGARPVALSASFILEEGLPMETLWRVATSMAAAAREAGVPVVTGDTKVVDRGKGDGVFISTAGVGRVDHALAISPASVRPGDALILSGDVGRHGVAVMALREGLAFETAVESDCAPVVAPVLGLLDAGLEVHCLRDLTRGGLATSLVEIAEGAGLEIRLEERAVSVSDPVRAACEILGLDPLYVANEGRFVCFLPADQADRALEILRGHPVSAGARIAGKAGAAGRGQVTLRGLVGADRILPMLSGEQLPRIC